MPLEQVRWLVAVFGAVLAAALGWGLILKAKNLKLAEQNDKLKKTNERLAIKNREYADRDEDREQELFVHAQWLKKQQRDAADKHDKLMAKIEAPKPEGQPCDC